jgi:hypothetical protein
LQWGITLLYEFSAVEAPGKQKTGSCAESIVIFPTLGLVESISGEILYGETVIAL